MWGPVKDLFNNNFWMIPGQTLTNKRLKRNLGLSGNPEIILKSKRRMSAQSLYCSFYLFRPIVSGANGVSCVGREKVKNRRLADRTHPSSLTGKSHMCQNNQMNFVRKKVLAHKCDPVKDSSISISLLNPGPISIKRE